VKPSNIFQVCESLNLHVNYLVHMWNSLACLRDILTYKGLSCLCYVSLLKWSAKTKITIEKKLNY